LSFEAWSLFDFWNLILGILPADDKKESPAKTSGAFRK
jgi:hypothetical protein